MALAVKSVVNFVQFEKCLGLKVITGSFFGSYISPKPMVRCPCRAARCKSIWSQLLGMECATCSS